MLDLVREKSFLLYKSLPEKVCIFMFAVELFCLSSFCVLIVFCIAFQCNCKFVRFSKGVQENQMF